MQVGNAFIFEHPLIQHKLALMRDKNTNTKDFRTLTNEARGLERIEFVGFANPESWYAKAKLLLLTSDLEGFGLVLVEAMASRCVPIALGSYPAVYDIVTGGCGIVVPVPYDEKRYAHAVESLMNDESKRLAMAGNGLVRAESFSVKAVVDRYEALFAKLGCHG